MRFFLMLAAATLLVAGERSGPYLSAGAGSAGYSDDGRLAREQRHDALQLRLGGGAFINEHLSVALDYRHFLAYRGETVSGEKAEQYFKALVADVSAHYPFFRDRFDLYATFGAGQIFWDQTAPVKHSNSAATLMYGVGVGVRALPWLTFNLGYEQQQFGMDDNGSRYDMMLGGIFLECQVQF